MDLLLKHIIAQLLKEYMYINFRSVYMHLTVLNIINMLISIVVIKKSQMWLIGLILIEEMARPKDRLFFRLCQNIRNLIRPSQ